MSFFEKKEGSIFFIPLFLPTDIKDNNKDYSNFNFEEVQIYGFGRLIEIDKSNGDLVEIFNYIGAMPKDRRKILSSGLIFYPLHVSLAFKKQRWRFIFEDANYDKNKDSNYKSLEFLLGDYDNPELWVGGKNTGEISLSEAEDKKHWIIFPPTKIEKKIKQTNPNSTLPGKIGC